MAGNPADGRGVHVQQADISWDFFSNLHVEREAFYSIIRRRELHRKERLFALGDVVNKVFYIVDGKVMLTTTSRNGKEIVVYIHKTGAILGLPGSMANRPRTVNALALTPCTIYEARTSDFKSLLGKYPVLSERVNLQLYIVISFITNLYLSALTDDAETRMKKMLARSFSEELLRTSQEGQRGTISTSLTQDHLAGAIGVSRERANRILHRFEKEGLISVSAHKISFLQPDHFLSYLEIAPLQTID